MLTIFKKEFRSFFRRGAGLIFLAVSAFFIGLLAVKHSFAVCAAQFEVSLHQLSVCFAVLLPLLSLRIFSKDANERTDKLLLALSFNPRQIVFGKYLTMLSLVAIDTVILAVFPIVLGFFGEVNYLASYLTIALFFIFCAAILALCTFVSAAMTDSLTSATLSYAIIVFGYLLNKVSIAIPIGVLKTIVDTVNFLSPFSHIAKFAAGTFSLDSIIYFVLFTALFLFLAFRSVKKGQEVFKYGKKSKEVRRFALSPILAVILTLCTVSVSALSSFIPAKYCDFDMYPTVEEQPIPDDLLGELSSETKEFISALETNVRIYILNPDGSDDSIKNFVSLYGENSDKITVTSTKAADIADKLIPLGWDGSSEIAPYTIVVESDKGEDRTQVLSPSSFYYYSHPEFGDMDYDTFSYYYSLLSQYATQEASYADMLESLVNDTILRSALEQMINSTVEYGVVDIIPRPYFLIGHGEPMGETSTLRQAFASFGFSFEDVDLTSTEKLPEDASVIIINTPTSDISEKEAAILKEFLKNGGSMSLVTNEKNLAMPNLMSLVNAYGVSAKPGFVSYDYEAEIESTETEAETSTSTEEAAEAEPQDKHVVVAYFNGSLTAFEQLEQYPTNAYYANHIDVSSELDENVIVNAVLTTDEKCYIDGVENSEGKKTVAVAIETKDAENPTRIVWFTGGDAFDGEILHEMNAYGSIYSIIWGIDDYESTLKEVEPKTIDLSFMRDENEPMAVSEKTTLIMNVIFVAAIPTVFAIVALIMIVKFSKTPSKKTLSENEKVEETEETNEE